MTLHLTRYLLVAVLPGSGGVQHPPVDGVDLRIADEIHHQRPAVSDLAVWVQNLGDTEGEGRLSVDILDETGSVLLHVPIPAGPRVLRVPAYHLGGKEGKVVRLPPSAAVEALLDDLERTATWYAIRASVESLAGDANWMDNTKTKEWNGSSRVGDATTRVIQYAFKNHSTTIWHARWIVEQTPIPLHWRIEGLPETGDHLTLAPDQEVRQTFRIRFPDELQVGSFLETRIAIVDSICNRVLQQHEFFVVYDTLPSMVSNYRQGGAGSGLQRSVQYPHSGAAKPDATGVSLLAKRRLRDARATLVRLKQLGIAVLAQKAVAIEVLARASSEFDLASTISIGIR